MPIFVEVMRKKCSYFLFAVASVESLNCLFTNIIIKFELVSCRRNLLNWKQFIFLALKSMRIASDLLMFSFFPFFLF